MDEESNVSTLEDRINDRIDKHVSGGLAVRTSSGGLAFTNMLEVMEFSKMVSISGVAIPKHLRGNPGACLAVVIQALEWKMSPYAVANKSYSVNDRLAYESQLVQGVILQRAPIKGRFKVKYEGEGNSRVCTVTATLTDAEGGGEVEYVSPPFGQIQPKNSPLWKNDPDQQLFYYSGRALCRRHFPDVLLGIYASDEIEDSMSPAEARDVTPARPTLAEKIEKLAQPTRVVDIDGDAEAKPEPDKKPATDKKPAKATKATEEKKPDAPKEPEAEAAAGEQAGGEAAVATETPAEEEKNPAAPVTQAKPAPKGFDKLPAFARTLENCMSDKKLQAEANKFLADNKIDEDSTVGMAANEIYMLNRKRILGDLSLEEVDKAVKKLLNPAA